MDSGSDSNTEHNSPSPHAVFDSHNEGAVINEPVLPFRFLDLPDELRVKIYQYCLPSNQRLFLDSYNINFPNPHVEEVSEGYGGCVINLSLVSKQIRVEAAQHIFTHNTVNVIKPLTLDNFLDDLGEPATRFICKLEVHVGEAGGLAELGRIWESMHNCPKLEDLRLVFYHDRINWSKTFAKLAHCAIVLSETNDSSSEKNIQLDLVLFTSVHPRPKTAHSYKSDMIKHVRDAHYHAEIFPLQLPPALKKITVTASVTSEATQGLMGVLSDTFFWSENWELRLQATDPQRIWSTLRLTKCEES